MSTFGGSYGGYLNKYDNELGLSDRIDVLARQSNGSWSKRFEISIPMDVPNNYIASQSRCPLFNFTACSSIY